jgi:D-xylose 1-dehydrogenase
MRVRDTQSDPQRDMQPSESMRRYPGLFNARVFITGGATGIGASLVETFAEQGARVAFNDIDKRKGKALASRTGGDVQFLLCDVTGADALKDSVDEAAQKLGGLNILINNVANDQRQAFEEIDAQAWRRSLAVNLDPVFLATSAAIPHLREMGGGSIINMSSLNAFLGPADLPAYTAAKAAIIGLTKTMARKYGPEGIRANAVVPGWVVTDRQKSLWLTPQAEREWKEMCCLRDDLLPEDVARLALFLASDDARMITNQAFIIDGGRI